MRGGLHVLTVEDEPAVTQLLALILGGPSAKVTNACDGKMALMKIAAAEEPFDLIITDHNMPRVSGLELVRRLRLRKFAGKIVVLSAYLSPENIEAYEKLQVDMMLAKPFDRRAATGGRASHEKLLVARPRDFDSAVVSSVIYRYPGEGRQCDNSEDSTRLQTGPRVGPGCDRDEKGSLADRRQRKAELGY